jgi:hypothetical protein
VIEYAGAIFLVTGFIVILKIFRVVDKSTRVIEISRQSVADLRSVDLDDDAKESAMQNHAKQLFGLFLLITIGGIAAVFLPIAVIWGLDRLQLVSIDAILSVTLSWPFIIATTSLICIVLATNRTG